MLFFQALLCVALVGYPLVVSESNKVYQNMVYFANWAIYDRQYHPYLMPADHLTHVLYAFLRVDSNGEVVSRDKNADLEKRYPSDSQSEQGHNAYGCVKQLYLLKKKHRSLKTLLSIGGYGVSGNFSSAASSEENRQRFAKSAVQTMGDWGFDGLDLDWEYPEDARQASNLLLLLHAVRLELDSYAARYTPSYRFMLSMALSAGPDKYGKLDLGQLSKMVDWLNLMAYDFTGSDSSLSGHQSNLLPSVTSSISILRAVEDYLNAGVNASKIIVGMPLYGRAFWDTDGLGKPCIKAQNGSWEAGAWDYKVLPRSGAEVRRDSDAKASYSYDPSTRELVSYDTLEAVQLKVEWLQIKGLGGSVFWEASGDRKGEGSLVRASRDALPRLDLRENNLEYPGSQFANIAAGMPTG